MYRSLYRSLYRSFARPLASRRYIVRYSYRAARSYGGRTDTDDLDKLDEQPDILDHHAGKITV